MRLYTQLANCIQELYTVVHANAEMRKEVHLRTFMNSILSMYVSACLCVRARTHVLVRFVQSNTLQSITLHKPLKYVCACACNMQKNCLLANAFV